MSVSPHSPDIAPIPAQAASTSLFSEPTVSGDQTSRRLRCLVEGDSTPFTLTVPINNIEIGDLKELIHEKCQNSILSGVDSKDLVLLRLKRPMLLKPSRTLSTRIRELDTASSETVEELDEPTDLLPEVFPQQPLLENLHILVKSGVDKRPFKRRRLSTPSLSQSLRPPPSDSSLRSNTVSALYARLKKYSFILVRGTPASGKTMLTLLLAQYIHQQEPAVHIILVNGWPLEKVKENGGWRAYLQREKGWEEGKKTIFIFDEAQMTYEDFDLWSRFFKSAEAYKDIFIIAFASYGSPTSSITQNYESPISTSSLGIPRTPFFFSDSQRVTLRPVDLDDDLDSVGLLFSRMEFDDLVRKKFSSPKHYFHPSFLDAIFGLTGGHVGAIHDFVNIIAAHDSYRQLRHIPGQLYTWDLFSAKVNLRDLVARFETSSSIFQRGLPRNKYLQKPAIVRIFSIVLRDGSITAEAAESKSAIGEGAKALRQCYRNGWLHADNDDEETVYLFPSPLHRWFVEWKLWNTAPAIPFESNNILQLVLDVIAGFSPRLLSSERRIGPGCIRRPPEAQYQDEFYRSCHAYSSGSLITFPEFDTGKGRADFYIPSKQWGVELLREGDRLEQHSGRFSRTGSYGTTLQLSDYIILDCRNTWPKYRHPGISKLYHIVFSNGYQCVSVLDNLLRPVDGGEMKLLASE